MDHLIVEAEQATSRLMYVLDRSWWRRWWGVDIQHLSNVYDAACVADRRLSAAVEGNPNAFSDLAKAKRVLREADAAICLAMQRYGFK